MTPIDALNKAVDWAFNPRPESKVKPSPFRARPNVFCDTCGTQHVYSRFLSDEDGFVDVCPKCFPEDV